MYYMLLGIILFSIALFRFIDSDVIKLDKSSSFLFGIFMGVILSNVLVMIYGR